MKQLTIKLKILATKAKESKATIEELTNLTLKYKLFLQHHKRLRKVLLIKKYSLGLTNAEQRRLRGKKGYPPLKWYWYKMLAEIGYKKSSTCDLYYDNLFKCCNLGYNLRGEPIISRKLKTEVRPI